jgi:C4-dicarboxylate transporter, DctM subunit
MSADVIGWISLLVLVLALFTGLPIAFVFGIIGFAGFAYASSLEGALNLLPTDIFATFSLYTFTVAPMFTLMSYIAFYSGITTRLYDTAHKFFGRMPGGLAVATIVASAFFGAICGSGIVAAVAMGKVAYPQMERYRYSVSLSTGTISAGAILSPIIPPSIIMIIYGIISSTSIGKLFIAGILPGVILAILFILLIIIMCWRNPSLGPPASGSTWNEKFKSLSGTGETLFLFIIVIVGMFIGVFTPTEAGAVGAVGAIVIALVRRKLTWKGFTDSLKETVQLTSMVTLIIAAATIFTHLIAISQIPFKVSQWVSASSLSGILIVVVIIMIYLIGGCFIDVLPLVMLTVPIFFPIITSLGYDPIWFGIIIAMMAVIGTVTPPVGMVVYALSSVSGVPLQKIFTGTYPFLAIMLLATAIFTIFPEIVMFLPNLMK